MEVESGQEADEINTVRAGGDYGWPSVTGRDRLAGTSLATVLLPPGTLPSGMTAVNHRQSPIAGDLIVSSAGLDDLLRIRMTPDGRPTGDESVRLLQGRFGAVGQVTATPDGALVFVTRNREAWGEGHDVLIRLTIQ
jgi:glucose/arabinose dehydrogenase